MNNQNDFSKNEGVEFLDVSVQNNIDHLKENSNINGKSVSNKKKFIVLGSIIVAIVLVTVGVIVANKFLNKTDVNDKGSNVDADDEYELENNAKNDTVWDDYSLVIDGKEIKLPMKFSDFQALGFREMIDSGGLLLDMVIPSGNRYSTIRNADGHYSGFGLFTNGGTSNISLIVYNESTEKKLLKDCYIIGLNFEVNYKTEWFFKLGSVKFVNNTRNVEVVVGETKLDDVVNLLGPHYQYDYFNSLNFYPDLKGDGVIGIDELSYNKNVYMYFDEDTMIFDIYGLTYLDTGDFVVE